MKTTGPAVTICLIIFATVFGGGISFAQPPQNEQTGMFPDVLPREESTIQKTTAVALGNLARARADIRRKEYTRARHELAEAERLAHAIHQDLSTAVAKNLIGVARTHLEFEPPGRVVADLPPIYAALDAIDIYMPTDWARQHLDKARVYLENSDKTGAQRELKLADRSLMIMEVELPLLSVEKYIDKAQTYLAGKDARNADKSLSIAEQRAQAISMAVGSPLFQAKNNLWLAFKNYSASRTGETRKQLEQAHRNLEKAARSGNKREQQEAERLSREVAAFEGKLNSRETGVDLALKGIWGRSKALAERSAEYLAAGWDRAETTLGEDNDLIEAKLHVSYAETYQVTAGEPDKAAEELDKADSYLKKALHNPLADDAAKNSMRGLDKDILALKANPERNDSRTQGSYESLGLRLSDLIQRIYLGKLVQKM